ncbi:hypothetical protein SUGI_1011290 [Cryptomeria japonica]|nr:hypothetical protein SUGI_1011290 [Cryptomeria japonica]
MGTPSPFNDTSSASTSQDVVAQYFKEAMEGKCAILEGTEFLPREDLPDDGGGGRGYSDYTASSEEV